MSRKIVLRGITTALVVLGCAGAFLRQTRPNLRPLEPNARKIAGWSDTDLNYWWISTQELLLLRTEGPGRIVLVRRNFETYAETPLVALTKLLRDSGVDDRTMHLSPDGKWMLWTGKGAVTWTAPLDGTKHLTVAQLGPTLNVWKNDSLGWYALQADEPKINVVFEHSLNAPGQIVSQRYVAAPFPNDPNYVNIEHITTTEREQLLVPYWNGGIGQLAKADILVTGFGATMRDVRTLRFKPPYENLGGELAFLPAAHKMAWRLNILLPRPQFLHDLGVLPSPRQSIGFWVTDLATHKTTSLGYLDTVPGDPHNVLTNLQFSPDGTRVSFIYHHALWAIPLDRS